MELNETPVANQYFIIGKVYSVNGKPNTEYRLPNTDYNVTGGHLVPPGMVL